MSPDRHDAIVVGSGIDELVAAARLAKAGLRVLVLESGDQVGGPAAMEEVLPGFRVDPVFPDTGYLPSGMARDLDLWRHGLELLAPDPVVVAPSGAGEPIVLWRDPAKTHASIAGRSVADADRWTAFAERMAFFARILEHAYSRPPLHPTGPPRDLAAVLGLSWRIRSLGRDRMVDLLRVLPLPAYDLLDDWFESDALKGVLAAFSVRGIFQGPRSPGTSLVLLHHVVGSPPGLFGLRSIARGGTGALVVALASAVRERGVEIRSGAEVARIVIENGRAMGVVLEDGSEIPARAVLSGMNPARTFLDLVGAEQLDPDFVHAVRKIRFRGGHARVHLALSEPPRFEGLGDTRPEGVIVIAPEPDYIEHAYDDAKHGAVSTHPVVEARIPSLADPTLAPPGRHVMSVDVRFVPVCDPERPMDHAPTGRPTERGGAPSVAPIDREAVGDRVVDLLAEQAPNFRSAILERRVLTPADFEARYGLTAGDAYQGELALDQLHFMRPVPGWARYRTPIRNLVICGPGTHPAGGITGVSGRLAASTILKDFDQGRAGRRAPRLTGVGRLAVEEAKRT